MARERTLRWPSGETIYSTCGAVKTLAVELHHNAASCADETAERLGAQFLALLESVADEADAEVGALEVVGRDERRRLLHELNRTRRSFGRDRRLHRLFEEQAARTPDREALIFEGRTISYAELNARANKLAHRLRTLGAGPDVPVGVLMGCSAEMVVCLLGILKSGAAYVPLDPAHPASRLAFILRDARTPLVLSQKHLASALPATDARVVFADAGWEELAGEKVANPEAEVVEENLAIAGREVSTDGRAAPRLFGAARRDGVADDAVALADAARHGLAGRGAPENFDRGRGAAARAGEDFEGARRVGLESLRPDGDDRLGDRLGGGGGRTRHRAAHQ